MKRLSLLAAVAALSVAGTAPADTTTYSESIKYTGGPGDAYTFVCDGSEPETGGIGGVCFTLGGIEISAGIDIADDYSPLPVGAAWRFTTGLGGGNPTAPAPEVLSEGFFCGSTADLPVPEGATYLVVFIDGPVFGPQDCELESPGIGIQGTVTAEFVIPA